MAAHFVPVFVNSMFTDLCNYLIDNINSTSELYSRKLRLSHQTDKRPVVFSEKYILEKIINFSMEEESVGLLVWPSFVFLLCGPSKHSAYLSKELCRGG